MSILHAEPLLESLGPSSRPGGRSHRNEVTIQHHQGERGWGRREEGGRPARRRGGRTQDALPELIGQQKRHCVLERKRILLCD